MVLYPLSEVLVARYLSILFCQVGTLLWGGRGIAHTQWVSTCSPMARGIARGSLYNSCG